MNLTDSKSMLAAIDSNEAPVVDWSQPIVLALTQETAGFDLPGFGRQVLHLEPSYAGDTSNADIKGVGYASITTSRTLNATMTGSLPDGTAFTAGGYLCNSGSGPMIPVYALLNPANDALASWVALSYSGQDPGYSGLVWIKQPRPGARLQSTVASLNLTGACFRYNVPAPGG